MTDIDDDRDRRRGPTPGSADACSGSLDSGVGPVGLDLAVAGFAAVWRRAALRPEELVSDGTAVEVAAALAAAGRAELDEAGRLIGIHGLTLRETRHRIEHVTGRHHTWCALDSIGIPAALGLDAVAVTDCPGCGHELRVDIVAGEPDETGVVLWLPGGSDEHLLADFCAAADLYCSEEHLRRVVESARVGTTVDVGSAATLGREIWADVGLHVGELDAVSPGARYDTNIRAKPVVSREPGAPTFDGGGTTTFSVA